MEGFRYSVAEVSASTHAILYLAGIWKHQYVNHFQPHESLLLISTRDDLILRTISYL